MPQGSTTLHESLEKLRPETVELHRAIVSLMEELEAVDWYGQRVDATDDEELRAILMHNRDEEKEHACMTLEWIRRRDPKFDEYLRKFLFQEGSIVGGHHEEASGESGDGSLGLGGLRGESGS
jgi:uncharacterized protein